MEGHGFDIRGYYRGPFFRYRSSGRSSGRKRLTSAYSMHTIQAYR